MFSRTCGHLTQLIAQGRHRRILGDVQQSHLTIRALSFVASCANPARRCVFAGLATGIDTLCSQASGAGQKRMMGVAFARGTLITILVAIPIAVLWYHLQDVLQAVGEFHPGLGLPRVPSED